MPFFSRWASRLTLVVLLAFTLSSAHAQVTFTLNPIVLSGNAGDLLSLLGTITNTSGEAIDLTSATANIVGPDGGTLTFDDTLFLSNFTAPLADGATYSETLFLTVSPTPVAGLYTASYEVELTGATTSTLYNSADQATVTISAAPVNAPEPTTLGLVIFSGVLVPLAVRRRA